MRISQKKNFVNVFSAFQTVLGHYGLCSYLGKCRKMPGFCSFSVIITENVINFIIFLWFIESHNLIARAIQIYFTK